MRKAKRFRRPRLTHPGAICDGSGDVIYMTRRQRAAYLKSARKSETQLREYIRTLFPDRRKADRMTKGLLRGFWSLNVVPVKIISERSKLKRNFVGL